MSELKTQRRLIDKDGLIEDYKREHRGPPGRALELIKRAQEIDADMSVEDYLKIKDEFCSQHECYECAARSYCGNAHEEAIHAREFTAMISEWLIDREAEKRGSENTYLEEFYSHYPNAVRNADGTPYSVCRKAIIGKDRRCEYGQTCRECWDMPIDNSKEQKGDSNEQESAL